MNIKIEISAPELVTAINALAKALTNQQPKEVEIRPVEQVELVKSTPEPEPETTMTMVELRGKVTDAIKQGVITNAYVRALLDKHGKQKLTDLDPNDYTAFLELLLPS